MSTFSLISINIHSNNNNPSLKSTYVALLPESGRPVPEAGSTEPPQGGGSTDLADWITGTAITCMTDPYTAPWKGYIADFLGGFGVTPVLATTVALIIVSAVVCAAPALLRRLGKKFW